MPSNYRQGDQRSHKIGIIFMPLPKVNLEPDFDILRISHTKFYVKDLEKSRLFYEKILGLQVTAEAEKQIFLRGMEERTHHSLILEEGDSAKVESLSFRLKSEGEIDKAASYFKKIGCEFEWVERPFQGKTLRTLDPHGMPLEFFYIIERLPTIHQKYYLYKGVKPLRVDHFNVFSPNVDESVRFYNEIGFRTTEYTEDSKTKKLWAAWMHRKGGVHDIAFTNGVGPRFHHLAFWVAHPINIIDLLDLMASKGYVSNIERGPGRHGISNAFFLYILDPDGHRIEIYCSDYQTIDPDHEPIHWDLTDPQRQTLWGAPAPKSWFEHGTNFLGVPTKKSSLKSKPIVAP